MKGIGKIDWAFSAGRIPLGSNGAEPEFIGHDKIAVLNTSDKVVKVEIVIFYEDHTPVGTYCFKVRPQRLRKIRFNDLVDPLAIQLGRNYGCYIKTSGKVVVQFSRMDTGHIATAVMGTMAFPGDT